MSDPDRQEDSEQQVVRLDLDKVERDRTLLELQVAMGNVLPGYPVMSRTEWDEYDPDNDTIDTGRPLRFSAEEASGEAPQVTFLWREKGFSNLFFRNPLASSSDRITQPAGSV